MSDNKDKQIQELKKEIRLLKETKPKSQANLGDQVSQLIVLGIREGLHKAVDHLCRFFSIK